MGQQGQRLLTVTEKSMESLLVGTKKIVFCSGYAVPILFRIYKRGLNSVQGQCHSPLLYPLYTGSSRSETLVRRCSVTVYSSQASKILFLNPFNK